MTEGASGERWEGVGGRGAGVLLNSFAFISLFARRSARLDAARRGAEGCAAEGWLGGFGRRRREGGGDSEKEGNKPSTM